MIKINEKSILDHILIKEKSNFHEKMLTTFNTDNGAFVNGNVTYRVPYGRTSINTLLTNNTSVCVTPETIEQNCERTGDYSDFVMFNSDGNTLLESVSNKFINIEANAPFAECIKTIHNFQQKAGKHFYGALLRSTINENVIINPLHILTAVSLLDNEAFLKAHKFNILIYIHSDRDNADAEFKTHIADSELIENNINALMQTYTTKYVSDVKVVESRFRDSQQTELKISYKELIHEDDDPNNIYHIVTHQLVTNGIIAPYYGASLIRWSRSRSSCDGIHLSPFRSCNINGYSVTRQLNSRNIEAHSVCTGSVSKTSLNGLRTLTHSYLGSPHNSQSLAPGFLAYADAMIEKALFLYTKAGFLEITKESEEESNYSTEELACKSFSDYVVLNSPKGKRTIALTKLKTQWDELKQYKESLTGEEEDEETIPHTEGITIKDTTIPVGAHIHFSYSKNKHPDEWLERNKGTILGIHDSGDFLFYNGNTKRLVKINQIEQFQLLDSDPYKGA